MKDEDFKTLTDEFSKETTDYSIPNEGACSTEFTCGCILCEE